MDKETIIRYIAVALLVTMCVQYIPLEGFGISYVKLGVLSLTPFVWLFFTPKFSKAFALGGVYFLVVLFSTIFHPQEFRLTTIVYHLFFVLMFIVYYNLVYLENVFTIDYFLRFLKRLILAYALVLVAQQVVHLVGMSRLVLFNTYSTYGRGFLAGNSLAIEPSHAARLLSVMFLALVRMYELKLGAENVTIKAIFEDAKWVVVGFVWSMLTMGSGTAFIGLAALSLYFIRRQYIFSVFPLLVLLYFAIPYIDYKPLVRAKVAFEATLTFDRETILRADHSAAARIVPLVNTLTNLDLTDSNTWFGDGVDSTASEEYLGEGVMLGTIKDYGLISYVLLLVFVYSCCVRFWSLENILFIALTSATLASVAYMWGMMLIFTTVLYFIKNNQDYEHT